MKITYSARRGRILWLLLLGLCPAASALAQDALILTFQERAGVERSGEFTRFGVPLARGWNLTDANNLRVLDQAGIPIPAQFRALQRWGGDPADASAPVKWVSVGFRATVGANGIGSLRLEPTGPGPSAPTQVSVDTSSPGVMVVDTGAASFTLNTDSTFNLLQQVTVAGRTLLQPLGAAEAIDYEPQGSNTIVPGGSPDLSPRVTSVVVEQQGPLQAVVRATGSILDDSANPVLDFTARLYFAADSSSVRVDFTVENNHPVIEGEWGQPTNVHDQGAINSVYLGSLALALRLSDPGGDLRVLTEESVTITAPAVPVSLVQYASGTDFWDAYVGAVGWPGLEASAAPRLQSYSPRRGFEITGPGVTTSGDQALGWMTAYYSDGPRISVAVRDFRQNFPKALTVGPEGTLRVDLFPDGDQFHHNLRVGEEKTHSILLDFGVGEIDAQAVAELALAFNQPLVVVPPPYWYAETGAIGRVPKADIPRWPLYERYVRVAFEPNPDFDPNVDDTGFGNSTLLDAIERYNFYGWQDYGDVPLDYEAFGPNQAGQMNLKYWYTYGMLVQFARSGDPRWLDLALPAARHMADADYLHTPDGGIQHWTHGAYFGHSEHDEPGNSNPNRNYNSPSVDLFFGVPDLLRAYHITGERRFLDVALEGLEGMANLSQFSEFTYPVFYRERANLIFGYLEGYRQTGDARWLNNLRTIVAATADLSNKDWLSDPDGYEPPAGGPQGEGSERISSFQFAQVAWTLGLYLDFLDEYGLSDDLGVATALSAYGDFMIDHLMQEIPEKPGYYALVDSIWFDAPWETYLEVNSWSLLFADVLAYAYEYSGEQRFLDAAAQLYATGAEDQAWTDDPPVYIASKDLVNALNWGLVYMAATAPPLTDPVLQVLANGSGTNTSVAAGSPVSISIAIGAGKYAGIQADWWVGEESEAGWSTYVYPSGWIGGINPAYQGELFDIASFEIRNGTVAEGEHRFYFGFDLTPNGSLDLGTLSYDSISVQVGP